MVGNFRIMAWSQLKNFRITGEKLGSRDPKCAKKKNPRVSNEKKTLVQWTGTFHILWKRYCWPSHVIGGLVQNSAVGIGVGRGVGVWKVPNFASCIICWIRIFAQLLCWSSMDWRSPAIPSAQFCSGSSFTGLDLAHVSRTLSDLLMDDSKASSKTDMLSLLRLRFRLGVACNENH